MNKVTMFPAGMYLFLRTFFCFAMLFSISTIAAEHFDCSALINRSVVSDPTKSFGAFLDSDGIPRYDLLDVYKEQHGLKPETRFSIVAAHMSDKMPPGQKTLQAIAKRRHAVELEKETLDKLISSGEVDFGDVQEQLFSLGFEAQFYDELSKGVNKTLFDTISPEDALAVRSGNSQLGSDEGVLDIHGYNDVDPNQVFTDPQSHQANKNGFKKLFKEVRSDDYKFNGSEDFAIGMSDGGYVYNLSYHLTDKLNRPVLNAVDFQALDHLFPGGTRKGSGTTDIKEMNGFFSNFSKKASSSRKVFHVNLDGHQNLKGKDGIENPFKPVLETEPGDYNTSTEIFALMSDPKLLKKTNFYFEGRRLSNSEVQRMIAPYLEKLQKIRNDYDL